MVLLIIVILYYLAKKREGIIILKKIAMAHALEFGMRLFSASNLRLQEKRSISLINLSLMKEVLFLSLSSDSKSAGRPVIYSHIVVLAF